MDVCASERGTKKMWKAERFGTVRERERDVVVVVSYFLEVTKGRR